VIPALGVFRAEGRTAGRRVRGAERKQGGKGVGGVIKS